MSESDDRDPFEDASSSSSYQPSETRCDDSNNEDELQTDGERELRFRGFLESATNVQTDNFSQSSREHTDVVLQDDRPSISTSNTQKHADVMIQDVGEPSTSGSSLSNIQSVDVISQVNREHTDVVLQDDRPSTSTSNTQRHADVMIQDVGELPASEPKKKSRKRRRQPKNWKVNILKEKHQSGQEHINQKGKLIPAKKVKTTKDCLNSCKYNCSKKISDSERLLIFTSFYKLSQNEKHLFILNSSTRCTTIRPNKKVQNSKRKYSFSYFFNLNNEKVQVCKKFYLGTLSISQKPVYNAHNSKDTANTPKEDKRGKNSSRKIAEVRVNMVKDHIDSFPKVESHYCRSSTSREYLESALTLRKMYELYVEKCTEIEAEPVKFSMYRFIFNTEFNLSFHVRKSDRCDLCEEYEIAKKENFVGDDLKLKYEQHVNNKNAMRAERAKDRQNNGIPVLCFDLQNVITLPRADISSFFYKRKLTVYNLTAHLSTSKTKYCAIWTECASGRGGNELASAFKKILEKVAEEHHFTKLITWSDSCIPQNRNSFISTAVLHFLRDNPQVSEITMKYSTPGHSCVQEVDSAHSAIEKAMLANEIYSPIGLVRLLKMINPTHPFRVIQMQENDFKDYRSIAKTMNFKDVPFTNVCCLRFTQCLVQVGFLTSFTHPLFRICNLRGKDKPARNQITSQNNVDLTPKPHKNPPVISNEKKNDIKSMLKFMPGQDQQYYKALLKI